MFIYALGLKFLKFRKQKKKIQIKTQSRRYVIIFFIFQFHLTKFV